VAYTAVYMLNKNGNNFLNNIAVFFSPQILSTLFYKAVAAGCVNDCLGISAEMHDTRLALIAFQNSKIAGKSSQYSM
jgi:hypothetical protein